MTKTKKENYLNIGALAVMFAAILWGLDGAVLTPRLYHLNNVALVVFLEHVIAFAFMLIPLALEWKEVKNLSKKDWFVFGVLALLSGALGTMAITKAVFFAGFVPLSIVAFLQKLQPIFAILAAMLLLGERPARKFFGWAIIALIGSYFVTFGFNSPVFNVGDKVFAAAMFSILAAAAFGTGTALSKYVLNKVNYRVGTYLRFGLTSLIMLVILTLFTGWSGISTVNSADIVTLLIIAFTTGGVAIIIYYFGLKKISASVSSICELAFPFSVVFFDYILRRNVMSVGQWFGAMLLVIAALAIINGKEPIEVLDVGEFPVVKE